MLEKIVNKNVKALLKVFEEMKKARQE